jgi:hypothetical protein
VTRAAAAPPRATLRGLRAARVQPLPVDERSEYARRGKLAPWQDSENLDEQWVLPAPHGAGSAGSVEVVTLPERGRPQYVGPRRFRDVWEQVRAGLVAHALMREDTVRDFRPPIPAGIVGDALVTLLLRRRVEHDHERRMNPRDAHGQRASWPKSTPTRRLTDLRVAGARPHGLQESVLWRPGLPEVPEHGARYLPRWWLWRKTWPGLHQFQRTDPLPVYQGNRGTGQSFIPVHVHEVTPADLPGSLRVVRAAGYVYRGSSTGEDWGHGPTQAMATITATPQSPSTKLFSPQWRATVDPLVAEGWSRDWRRVP